MREGDRKIDKNKPLDDEFVRKFTAIPILVGALGAYQIDVKVRISIMDAHSCRTCVENCFIWNS